MGDLTLEDETPGRATGRPVPIGRPAAGGQLVRFLAAGGAASLATVAAFLGLVALGVGAMAANLLSFLVHLSLSYALHSRWSFGGWGGSDRAAAPRYLATMLINLALNSLWVWLMTGPLALPDWTPVLPMVTVTPAIGFLLARLWVFAR